MAAVIPALEPDLRPAYITDRGPVAGSFIRTGDGDKRLTHYEVDRMCESRMQPVWDTEHVSRRPSRTSTPPSSRRWSSATAP